MNHLKIFLFTPLLICLCIASYAQTGLLKGRLLHAGTGTPAADVPVAIPSLKILTTSSGLGEYSVSPIPYGNYTIVIGGAGTMRDTFRVTVSQAVTDMGDRNVSFNEASAVTQQQELLPLISLDAESFAMSDEEGVGGQNVSGLLTGSRDPFINTIAYTFGSYRFQPRGYDRNQQEVLINGVPMNDVETGDAYWSQWGGLNDVFRGRSQTYGLAPSEFAYGGINGTVFFDATAAAQRRQLRATYSLANRSYRHRAMLSWNTGMMQNGWAFSLSASRRWAEEGYAPGTFYDGYSYFAAVSKKINNKSMLHLTVFGAPTRRGKMSPATQEAYDLAGSNFYNPNWGYQDDKKRNSRIGKVHQPVGLLSFDYTPNSKTRWQTSLSYQTGSNKNSVIDWYNGVNPKPDYYRYMPSYYASDSSSKDPSDALFLQQQQVDWDALYQANYGNYETHYEVNGIAGNNVYGRRSVYILSNYVDDIKKGTVSSSLQQVLDDHITLHTGIRFVDQRTETYREVEDLLGGDYFVNLNQFAMTTKQIGLAINQFDLDHPNRIIKEGDRYNFNYIQHFQKGWAYLQAVATYNKVDFFISGMAGFNTFNREGLFRNGLFPNNSLGLSEQQTFVIYGLKGGATYKLNGRNYLFVNAGLNADAPTFDNTFISPRTRNTTIEKPVVQIAKTIEGGYLMRAPRLNIRAVGYATSIDHATRIKTFYEDYIAYRTLVNYVTKDISMQYTGAELAVNTQVTPEWALTGVAALGQAFYTNNPDVSVIRDNDTAGIPTYHKVYIKNYNLAAGPRTAASLAVNYRSPKYWYASLTGSYYDNNYMDINHDRRTVQATEPLTPGTELYRQVVEQQKFPGAFSLDLFAGASILLNKYIKSGLPQRTFLYINLSVNNILDNKKIITGGFEQTRYDFSESNVDKFPPKYFYAFGRNFSLNLSLKF